MAMSMRSPADKPWTEHSRFSELIVFTLSAVMIVIVAWLVERADRFWEALALFVIGMLYMRLFRFITSGSSFTPRFDSFVVFLTGFWSRFFDFLRKLWPWGASDENRSADNDTELKARNAVIKGQRETIRIHARTIKDLEESNAFLRAQLVAAADIEPPEYSTRETVIGNAEPVTMDVSEIPESVTVFKSPPGVEMTGDLAPLPPLNETIRETLDLTPPDDDTSIAPEGQGNTPLDPEIFDDEEAKDLADDMMAPYPQTVDPEEVTYDGDVAYHDPNVRSRADRGRAGDSDRVLVSVSYSWDEDAVETILNNADEDIDLTDEAEVVRVVLDETIKHGVHASRYWVA